ALVLAWLLGACTGEPATTAAVPPAAAPAPLQVQAWALPAPPGAAQPDLALAPDGRLLLSWIEPLEGGGHRLQLACTQGPGHAWTPALTVAQGGDWFVNWADTPHVTALADGSLRAHWLENTGPYRMD